MANNGLLVGRGIADITGESAGCELLGYGRSDQRATGIHTRLRARAFILAEAGGAEADWPPPNENNGGGGINGGAGNRVMIVVNDLAMIFDSVHREVLRRLRTRFDDLYTEANVMLTATHTHCGPGGYSHHLLYILSGYHPKTFAAIVDGIMEAAERAHADLAPTAVRVARDELHDASVNRSRSSFERNPEEDRAFFPGAIDPQTTLMRFDRAGSTVGAINFFATHGTSMTNRNTLVSGDNKGYAAYHWERLVAGVDYLADGSPGLIAAFAQTNAGDMSPNLNLAPGSGPTGDEWANTRIIGERQYEAAAALALAGTDAEAGATGSGRVVDGGIDSRITWFDLANTSVDAEFTGDGDPHRTGRPAAGASAFAGTSEGPAFKGFRQGQGHNPVWEALTNRVLYPLSPAVRDAQSPKAVALPGSPLNAAAIPLVQERVPVQLIRLGHLYLIGIPGEVTIVAGLRLRRAVAAIVGADVLDVLVVGYTNAYIHYVTTPEEYDAQRYEGGSTLFGRWELGAFLQVITALATAMRDGKPAATGPRPPDLSAGRRGRRRGRDRPMNDVAPEGHNFGDVVGAPRARYLPGEQARVTFVGAHPSHDLHRGGTYVEVQRRNGDGWHTVADDGDWATKFRWARPSRNGSVITVTWDIPAATPAGRYRIRYRGDAADRHGRLAPFTGSTLPFEVMAFEKRRYQPMVPGSPLNGPITHDVTQPP